MKVWQGCAIMWNKDKNENSERYHGWTFRSSLGVDNNTAVTLLWIIVKVPCIFRFISVPYNYLMHLKFTDTVWLIC